MAGPAADGRPGSTERRGGQRALPAPAIPAWSPFCGSGCLLAAVFLAAGAGLGLLRAESVGDALVGGIRLTVDAVRVDLQQDRDAVPGPASDLGGGHPGVEPQRDSGVAQIVGRRPSGERYCASMSAALRFSAQTALGQRL